MKNKKGLLILLLFALCMSTVACDEDDVQCRDTVCSGGWDGGPQPCEVCD